jgi:dipeptidyl aminopeptidase/acylaminoacyl peptidase
MNNQSTVPLIPRKLLFGNPDKASPRISPDGSKLAFLAPVDGVLNVWVGLVEDPDAAMPVTKDTVRGIRIFFWAYSSNHILYLQDKAGDENWRLYSVNLKDKSIKDLTPLEGVQAEIIKVSPEYPSQIVVGINDRDPQLHDIYLVNIDTAERTLIQQNTAGYLNFLCDDEFHLRFAQKMIPDGSMEIFQKKGDDWSVYQKIPLEDTLSTSPIGMDKEGTVLYLTDSRGRDTAAFYSLNLENGEKDLIAEDERTDIDDILIHPTTKIPLAVAFNYERKQWRILDGSIAKDLAYLRTVADGDVEVVSWTQDLAYWVVAFTMDNGPVRYYLHDHKALKARFLFTNRSALEGVKLSNMHPVVIPARDGLELVSYYTLPPEYEGSKRPDHPLPMILFVHGGPWGRDNWGYNPFHQIMANRGYAVLSVNFRASTGFGKGFINSANLEWGAKMHDDLIDGVDWAIREGIADPGRIAIMGGSYGGYATLVGVTFTPEKFACGVDIVGPSNLITLINSVPPYWQPMIEMFAKRMGDHRTEEGRKLLKSRSPLTYVDRIIRPLLIGQGANDPRVNQAESDQIVHAMQEKNIPVTYVLYPDEGHGFARPENNISFFAVAEAFLAEHLGGRYEPIGSDFEGSSITVPVGAEFVPGLSEVINKEI